jgi:hypothetical protein
MNFVRAMNAVDKKWPALSPVTRTTWAAATGARITNAMRKMISKYQAILFRVMSTDCKGAPPQRGGFWAGKLP